MWGGYSLGKATAHGQVQGKRVKAGQEQPRIENPGMEQVLSVKVLERKFVAGFMGNQLGWRRKFKKDDSEQGQ